VSRVSTGLDVIKNVYVDPSNPEVFFSGCGAHSDDLKLYVTSTLDQVINFPTFESNEVRFVIGTSEKSKNKKYRIIGHKDG